MASEPKNYDLIVIGGGPAGIIGATVAAAAGQRVAVVDSHHELGGAGINTGTVPSKTLRETALALSGMRSRDLYGVDLSLRRETTVADFLTHEHNVKTGFNTLLSKRLEADTADLYFGTGSFLDPHTIRVEPGPVEQSSAKHIEPGVEAVLRGKYILIATGSSPVRPAIFPFDHPAVYDSDTILELACMPKTLAVIGAGVIGCEYACTFAALGTQVHLIDGRDVLLPFLDGEVSHTLMTVMERNGIVFHWCRHVEACAAGATGPVVLKVCSADPIEVDAVLVAAGRASNTEKLNLPAAGVAVGDHGIISVDEFYCTNVPHIYAAGDVIGFPALASTSMQQARHAIRHALGRGVSSETSHLLPTGIYTIPEASMVGATEESLKKQGVEYVIGRASYQDNSRGRIIGERDGFLKLLFDRNGKKLLGVHVIGEQATELVHIGLMAMLGGLTADAFEEACFNVPTLGGLYKFAALDATMKIASPGRRLADMEGMPS